MDYEGEPSGFKANRSYLITEAKRVELQGQAVELFKVKVNNKSHEAFVVKSE